MVYLKQQRTKRNKMPNKGGVLTNSYYENSKKCFNKSVRSETDFVTMSNDL